MPIYEYECTNCRSIFEVIVDRDRNPPPCPSCGSGETRKIMVAPTIRIREDRATASIGKRVKDYLKDGKVSDAMRFADKAASMVKSDKVKRIAFTPRTLISKDELEKEIASIRETDIAYDREEPSLGELCIATAVFNMNAKVEAALSISLPKSRVVNNNIRIEDFAEPLLGAAKKISERLSIWCNKTSQNK